MIIEVFELIIKILNYLKFNYAAELLKTSYLKAI